MTANELADELVESNSVSWGSCTHEQHNNDKYFKEQAATMLRQQQAEIEALKQQYELYGAVWHDEHGYQFTATVGEKVLNDDRWIKLYRKFEK